MENQPLRIDIVSDVVCPWCIVGYKQLEKALAETGVVADIHWHPFELNPNMAEEGENLTEHIIAKYGITREDSRKNRDQLTAIGTDLGFAFHFTDDMRMPNTFRAQQLLHWAGQPGRKHDLKMTLFDAHFTHRENINDPEVLAKIAGEVDLDPAEAIAVLASGEFAEAVRDAENFWMTNGIRGVPSMIFDQKHMVTGAQGVANYIEILRSLV